MVSKPDNSTNTNNVSAACPKSTAADNATPSKTILTLPNYRSCRCQRNPIPKHCWGLALNSLLSLSNPPRRHLSSTRNLSLSTPHNVRLSPLSLAALQRRNLARNSHHSQPFSTLTTVPALFSSFLFNILNCSLIQIHLTFANLRPRGFDPPGFCKTNQSHPSILPAQTCQNQHNAPPPKRTPNSYRPSSWFQRRHR